MQTLAICVAAIGTNHIISFILCDMLGNEAVVTDRLFHRVKLPLQSDTSNIADLLRYHCCLFSLFSRSSVVDQPSPMPGDLIWAINTGQSSDCDL